MREDMDNLRKIAAILESRPFSVNGMPTPGDYYLERSAAKGILALLDDNERLRAEQQAVMALLYSDEVFVGTHWDGPPLQTTTLTWPVLCAQVSTYGADAEEIPADQIVPLANLLREFGNQAIQAWVCHCRGQSKPDKGTLGENGQRALAALAARLAHEDAT